MKNKDKELAALDDKIGPIFARIIKVGNTNNYTPNYNCYE